MLESLADISLTDLLDVTVVGLLLWGLVAWARRVGAHLALLGLALLVGLYAVALQLKLLLTIWVFRGFFAGLLVLVVVIFQDDLRRLFEQIATLGLRRHRHLPSASAAAAIHRAVAHLARNRTGALVVVAGREPLDRHLAGGVDLDAQISEELLLSLFDPHSPGHDGAVLVRGDRIVRFAVHLPLSADRDQLGAGGTRHAAALGLAQRTDALAVVVSEERGTVSVAQTGRLQQLADPSALIDELQDQLRVSAARHPDRTRGRAHLLRAAEALAAFALALAGWLAFVPGAAWEQATREVPVRVEALPAGYSLTDVDPPEVQVTIAGPRRQLLLAQSGDFEVVIDASLVALGRRTFSVDAGCVRHDTELEVVDVQPDKVRLSARSGPDSGTRSR